MKDFDTVTKEGQTIFAAFHEARVTAPYEPFDARDLACMSIAVGQSTTYIEPKDARALGRMLLRGADKLEGKTR
jgi:hypothetical protein